MTKKRALQVLLDNAAQNIAGVGQGIRSTSESQKAEVARAMAVIWPLAYNGIAIRDSDYLNRGVNPPTGGCGGPT